MGADSPTEPPDLSLLMANLDRLGVGYYRSDAGGRIVAVNAAGAAIYGYTPEEMLAGITTMDTNVSEEERLKLTAILDREGCATRFSVPGRHKSGRTIFVNASIQPLKDSAGAPAGYEGVFTDSTAQVELERQRAEALGELRRTNAELGHLATFQEQFLAALAHDLQTPPVVIQGMSELLIRGHYGALKETQDKAVRTIHRNVLQFSQMMEQLLDFSRMLHSRPKGPPLPTSLQESVDRILKETRSEWQELYIRCSVDRPAEPLRVSADMGSLDFLVRTLFLNAGAYVRQGFELKGTLDEADGMARLVLIADPVRPTLPLPARLLQKFFVIPTRGEEDSSAAVPLGLAAGAYVASLLLGSLHVEPAGKTGLAIRLTLPLAGEGNPRSYPPAPRTAESARRASTVRETARNARSRSRK